MDTQTAPKRHGGALPDLRIIDSKDLLLHEEVDLDRVARLIDRLASDGLLKHPPIAASLPGSAKLMLLDGANRVAALRNLDVPHLLVQVEDYDQPALQLDRWNHVVRDIESDHVIAQARTLPGVRLMDGRGDELDPLEDPDHLVTFAFSEERALHLLSKADLASRAHSLCALAKLYYRGAARMDRISHTDFASLRAHYQHIGALVIFPRFSKANVRAIAEQGVVLPSGITRFLVPRRVLGFNLQVAILSSHLPLDEKRHWLEETISKKLADRRVRYYQEPTYVFDE